MADATRDWLVVVAVIVGLIGVPLAMRLWPANLPYRVAFVILPLLPGIGLGLLAIWYAVGGGDR